jgi:hypothetical protein
MMHVKSNPTLSLLKEQNTCMYVYRYSIYAFCLFMITLITYQFSCYSSLVLLAFVLACACVPPSLQPRPSGHVLLLLAYQHQHQHTSYNIHTYPIPGTQDQDPSSSPSFLTLKLKLLYASGEEWLFCLKKKSQGSCWQFFFKNTPQALSLVLSTFCQLSTVSCKL